MTTRMTLALALLTASICLAPIAGASHGSGNSGSGNSGSGSNSCDGPSGGSGSSSGSSGGSSGGGSVNNATTVRSAQRALKDGAEAAERVVKDQKDAQVRRIFILRAQGASSGEIAQAVSEATALINTLTAQGISQVNALRDTLLAGLSSNATAGQRNAVNSAAASGVGKLTKRQRSATQDINRAAVGRIPAVIMNEHGPNHQ